MKGTRTSSAKDVWDKLDVLVKLVASVVLVAIGMAIRHGTSQIATSLETGGLIQSLIADLSSVNGEIRRDLALIALNHSIGDRNPELVAQVAERLYQDRVESETTAIRHDAHVVGELAFEILRKRNPQQASKIEDELSTKANAPEMRKALVSDANILKTPPDRKVAVRSTAELLARVYPSVVYIQYRTEGNQDLSERLRRRLTDSGYHAPGVELVAGKYTTSVRYFRPDDEALAEKLAGEVQAFLKQEGKPREVPTENLSGIGYNPPPGQIEVWLRVE